MGRRRRAKKKAKSSDEVTACMICLSPPKFPKGRPDACNHIFCHLCLSSWMRRRSECPLCKRPTKFIVKMYANGKTKEIEVEERTAEHYEYELVRDDEDQMDDQEHEQMGMDEEEEMDEGPPLIDLVDYCLICRQSDNENHMLYCDGIVGYDEDGMEIRCNATYHCYCLPERLPVAPDGEWFCPFCIDMLETQRGVYSTRYSRSQQRSSTEPGTSAFTLEHERWRYEQEAVEFSESEAESGSSSDCEELEQSDDDDSVEVIEDSDHEEEAVDDHQNQTDGVNEPGDEDSIEIIEESDHEEEAVYDHQNQADDVSEQHEPSNDADEAEVADERDWEQLDETVLAEEPDVGYSDAGRTKVSRTRKRRKRTVRKGSKKRKKATTKPSQKHTTEKRRRKKKSKKKPKRVSAAQRRLANAIRIDPVTGARQVRARRERPRAAFLSDGIRRGPFGAPLLSINTSDNDELPIHEPEVKNDEPKEAEDKKTPIDLMDSIMFEQTKTLAPSFCTKLLRDGSIRETEHMAKHRKKIEEKISGIGATAQPKMEERLEIGNATRSGTRKNRSTRWDTPTTSVQNTNVTASIPLPTGPPMQQTISLDAIPVPNRATAMCPPISPHVALAAGPSSLNTSPSTSFTLNALAPPFGMGPSSLCTQPNIGISSIANAHLGQQQLLQLPHQVFPNLLMQPSFPIGAMNNILAAGLLGNAPLGPPISQAGTPFVFSQMQMPTHNQQLTQQLANLASLQSATNSQQPRLPIAGVPPPPPMATRVPEVDVSLEPLAERIRQLTEGNAIHSFGEETTAGSSEKQSKEEPKGSGEWGGRKSASAEEEEASDADGKIHKNGPMFDEARHMLSESLKKAYKKKRITKDEYKEIMKKGVTALSQRTKLDERKVNEYANKYVDYVLRRRKKKQPKEH